MTGMDRACLQAEIDNMTAAGPRRTLYEAVPT